MRLHRAEYKKLSGDDDDLERFCNALDAAGLQTCIKFVPKGKSPPILSSGFILRRTKNTGQAAEFGGEQLRIKSGD